MQNKLITRAKIIFLLFLSINKLFITLMNLFSHVFSFKGCARNCSAWKLNLRKGAASLFFEPRQKSKASFSCFEALPLATLTILTIFILSAQCALANEKIALDKSTYGIGETVKITLNNISENDSLSMLSDKDVFRYSGELKSELAFYPEDVGNYTVQLDSNGMIIEEKNFIVKENPPEIPLLFKLSIKDKRGMDEQSTIAVLVNASNAPDKYDVEISPSKAGIKKIRLNNLIMNANASFELDEIALKTAEREKSFDNKKIIHSFFIDTAQLNYTDGAITNIAAGKELWKCKAWDQTQGTCLGQWSKVMDLTPGKEYEISLTPEDPAYVETGVTSINTKKPIYHPGETASIIMVVLDTNGHLMSNADVSLTITSPSPDNRITTLATSTGEIAEASRGIYETSYTLTTVEGHYSMDVRASGNNVNSTMLSYFMVKSDYEFDILRDTPVTTDPWSGAFTSNIRIISYADYADETAFNFTELLPDSFEIIDSGGATITTTDNQAYLMWTNLQNNSVVSYSVKPPLLSPELYELGPSFVNYDNTIFYETRPWYLAVDPGEQPDLIITNANITFSNESPKEGSNITINATIYDIGNSDDINVTTQFFLGDPDAGGTQMNGNFTDNITQPAGNKPNATYSVNWTVTGPGPFNFYVVTNGSIQESNASNNKANQILNVPAYNYFYGRTQNNLYLANSQNKSLYYYIDLTSVTGNIFVASQGENINFASLQALGINILNNTASNDFNETDAALNMTTYNDSIRALYTNLTDTPILTMNITIFKMSINNVPVINSTNVSSFVTGILWDTSDGNTEYNGTQDLLFVTQINASKTGAYGTYDYEIKVPVNLKNYKTLSSDVNFYWEITGT